MHQAQVEEQQGIINLFGINLILMLEKTNIKSWTWTSRTYTVQRKHAQKLNNGEA